MVAAAWLLAIVAIAGGNPMELRGEASVTAWARVLRENHRDHPGKPPPRRQHDGEVLIP